jgi:hypothetical protein
LCVSADSDFEEGGKKATDFETNRKKILAGKEPSISKLLGRRFYREKALDFDTIRKILAGKSPRFRHDSEEDFGAKKAIDFNTIRKKILAGKQPPISTGCGGLIPRLSCFRQCESCY